MKAKDRSYIAQERVQGTRCSQLTELYTCRHIVHRHAYLQIALEGVPTPAGVDQGHVDSI